MKPIAVILIIVFSFCLCFFLFSCASSVPKRVSLDPASQKFLDLIGYIILPIEEKIFREMPPEDRGEFIKDFWARRDPDPSTPENEFRRTYYTRLAIGDKAFKVGKPGWKTDRGRIYILLGPPTNVITKSMGDVPYEQAKFVKANPIETGTITERPTEIWVYDNYPEYFAGPLRLVFVDYHGTGDYQLTTKLEITPFSMVSPTWDPPNLAKYQWLGQIQMDEKTPGDLAIFDYDVYADISRKKGEAASVIISIDIPCYRLDFHKKQEKFTCDLSMSAEIRDTQSNMITRQEKQSLQVLSKNQIRSMVTNKSVIHNEIELDFPLESKFIYISVTDNVTGKRLRKLLQVKDIKSKRK